MSKFESNALVWREMSWDFWEGNECDGAPQRLLDFTTTLKMWDLVR